MHSRQTMQLTFLLSVSILLFATSAAASQAPVQMRAVRMHDYGSSEVLRVEQAPMPTPAAGHVRIRVHAAGVNPVDWKVRAGRLKRNVPLTLPHILGRDVAGTIDAVGNGVARWKAGDQVIALIPLKPAGGGAFSEYVIVAAQDVAPKPARLSFEEAAGIPVASLAAWRTLIEVADVQRGQRVLIHGGAGGVGSAAVQLAHWRGAHVIATASERNHQYLKSIGADETIDYRTTRFEEVVKNADVVLDTVGGDTLQRSVAVVREGGMLLTVVGMPSSQACTERKIRCPNPDDDEPEHAGERLEKIGQLYDSGKLKMTIQTVLPLEQASKALELSETGHTRGKIILRVLAE
jgi:NADPH:quinone reductase-like Zn-dependent oxidoreductase